MLDSHSLFVSLLTSFGLVSAIKAATTSEKQKYSFVVFSNPVDGREAAYRKWYEGQHIHDLLSIPGFVAAQFFKLADTQFDGIQLHRYMMIWEIETDDLPSVFTDVQARLSDGRTVSSNAFDLSYNSITMLPVSKRVTANEIKGKSVDEVERIAKTL